MANGRCVWHGGATPTGDGWHRPRWPNGASPDAEKKLVLKLRAQERAAKKRASRIAAMTPDERERHERWQQAHAPGSATKRAAKRAGRKSARDAAELMFAPQPPGQLSAEARTLAQLRDDIRSRLAVIEGQPADDEGIFG